MTAQRKEHEKIDRHAAFAVAMRAAFPHLFDPKRPRALAIGIHSQLRAALPDASMTLVRTFLRRWTRRGAYLKALAADTYRLNLDGSQAEPITAEHQALAKAANERNNARRSAAKPKRFNKVHRPRVIQPGPIKSAIQHNASPAGKVTAQKPPSQRRPAPSVTVMVKKRRVIKRELETL